MVNIIQEKATVWEGGWLGEEQVYGRTKGFFLFNLHVKRTENNICIIYSRVDLRVNSLV